MKTFINICGIFIISILFLNCNYNKYEFQLSTSGCYGNCPIIDMKLVGRRLYINKIEHIRGEYKFNYKGIFVYDLSKKEFDSVKLLINQIDLLQIGEEYVSNIDDTQYYNLILRKNNKVKEIYMTEKKAPNNVSNLVNYLMKFNNYNATYKDTIMIFESRKKVQLNPIDPPPPMPELNVGF